ncbi:hypothetical protein A6F68_00899 [Tsuneonella dongtanensis]|uniref:O-Antigen ligase n=1 Tax=Tsuneonella dongtanensis TaxID=692370 RepID=A0A1B2ABJ3_9SPHN|nr:hypothetical protein [Tsuneonella dongtanensis]ANY19425.1 hypothetical protein A6F68_00899 [Tsuneonella dongtanensis]
MQQNRTVIAGAGPMTVRSAPQAVSTLPIILMAGLFYLLLLPDQLNPRISGILLPPYRVYLMLTAVFLVVSGVRERFRPAWPDFLIAFCAAWIFLASYVTSAALGTAMIMAGAHLVDIALAYFLARSSINSPRDLRLFLVFIAPAVGIASFFVVQESITGVRIAKPLAAAISGVPFGAREEERLGLMRGMGTFNHPIHAGLFLASFLPLYLMASIRGWPAKLGVAASIGAFFSLSSAALLGLLFGGALRFYDWLTVRVANATWSLFLIVSAAVVFVIEMLSNTGTYGLLVRYASLQTASAYNRILIWGFGTANVAENPWFGIGYGTWERPWWMHSGSFDHFWLLMALRFGIPASLALTAATVAGVWMVARRSRTMPPMDALLLRGVAISLAVFALGAISVSLWLSLLVWFFMLLGIAVGLATARSANQ